MARFMWPTWGPPGEDKTLVGPMLAPWTLLSGMYWENLVSHITIKSFVLQMALQNLTHWGGVSVNYAIIGSTNDLSPVRRRAII